MPEVKRARAAAALLSLLTTSACGFDVPLGADDAGPCGDGGLGAYRPDPTFGVCGTVSLDVAQLDNVATGTQGLAVDAQGRAYLAGTTGSAADRNLGVVRLAPDGTLDSTFGTAGLGEVSLNAADEGHGVLLMPDGAVIVSGHAKTMMNEPIGLLGKLSASGSPELGFGMSGHAKVSATVGAAGTCLGIWRRPSDGALACSGTGWRSFPQEGDLAMVAVDGTTGVPQGSFGTAGGGVMVDLSSLDQRGAVAVTTADGKVLLPGSTEGPTQRDFALARFDASGALDPSFTGGRGGPGLVTIDFNGGDDECRAVLPLADGSAWCVGSARLSPTAVGGAIARVLPGGALDPNFGTGGKRTLSAFSTVWAVVALDDGTFLVGGDALTARGDLAQALQVLDPQGGEVSALLTLDLSPGDDSVRSLVRDGQGRLWLFGATNGDWSLQRWVPAERRAMGVGSDCSSSGGPPFVLLLAAVLRSISPRRRGAAGTKGHALARCPPHLHQL